MGQKNKTKQLFVFVSDEDLERVPQRDSCLFSCKKILEKKNVCRITTCQRKDYTQMNVSDCLAPFWVLIPHSHYQLWIQAKPFMWNLKEGACLWRTEDPGGGSNSLPSSADILKQNGKKKRLRWKRRDPRRRQRLPVALWQPTTSRLLRLSPLSNLEAQHLLLHLIGEVKWDKNVFLKYLHLCSKISIFSCFMVLYTKWHNNVAQMF